MVQAGPSFDSDIDWVEVRAYFRTALARSLDAHERSQLDDLVQEACIRLLRALGREAVRELDGLMAVIARRTLVDHVRRRTLWRKWFREWHPDSEVHIIAQCEAELEFGSPLERVELVVLELFAKHAREECAELAQSFFEDRGWKQAAMKLEMEEATVRKRWSRCLSFLRTELQQDVKLRILLLRS